MQGTRGVCALRALVSTASSDAPCISPWWLRLYTPPPHRKLFRDPKDARMQGWTLNYLINSLYTSLPPCQEIASESDIKPLVVRYLSALVYLHGDSRRGTINLGSSLQLISHLLLSKLREVPPTHPGHSVCQHNNIIVWVVNTVVYSGKPNIIEWHE